MPSLRGLLVAVAALLLLAPALAPAGDAASIGVHDVPIKLFPDLLFGNVDGAFDAAVDPATGDVWYATGAGLVHVNAALTARRVLAVAEGLPTPLTYTVEFGADGMLWAGTDAGLVRVDPKSERVTFWNPSNTPNATAFIVSFAQPNADGSVWVGSTLKGVGLFWPASGKWEGPWSTGALENHAIVGGGESPTGFVVAARNDGFLRWNASGRSFTPILEPEQYALQSANAYVYANGTDWFGTDAGVWRYNASNGTWTRYLDPLLALKVTDLSTRGRELWVSSPLGVAILNFDTGNWSYATQQRSGLISNSVRRTVFSGDLALFATLKGLTIANFVTKSTANLVTGPSNGPNANSLLGGAEHGGRVWFGTTDGVSGFDPTRQKWTSFGIVDNPDIFNSLPVNDVVSDHDRLWMATKKYVWMFNDSTRDWISINDDHGTNFYYHLDVDGTTLWLPEYGTGLVEYDWLHNVTRRYDPTSPNGLFEWLVLDARHTDKAVWVASVSGLYRLDKTTKTFTHFTAQADHLPTNSLDRIWVDGKDLWLDTTDRGLVRFSTENNQVTAWFNKTGGNFPNFPGTRVRALVRDGANLWLGLGEDGLARVNPVTHEVKRWTLANGLPESHVNGLVLKGGILYVSTHGGMARLDTSTLQFLPMHVADPALWLLQNPSSEEAPEVVEFKPSVEITFPASGTAVTGELNVQGRASKPGSDVDRVEVSVGTGPWQTAQGTGLWSFALDTSTLPLGDVTLHARSVSGNETSKVDDVTVTVVPAPKEPLAIHHTPPVGLAFAGRDVRISAEVRGDEPLKADVYYQIAGANAFKRLALARDGTLWNAVIPAGDARAGTLRYFLEASSGRLTTTLPADKAAPFELDLRTPPSAAIVVEAPPLVVTRAGERTTFTLNVTNVGQSSDNYVLEATGLRASWVEVDSLPFRLTPGERAMREVSILAPARAFADNTTLSFTVKPVASAATPVKTDVPLRVVAAPVEKVANPTSHAEAKGFGAWIRSLPAPGAPLAFLALVAALALADRRRRA